MTNEQKEIELETWTCDLCKKLLTENDPDTQNGLTVKNKVIFVCDACDEKLKIKNQNQLIEENQALRAELLAARDALFLYKNVSSNVQSIEMTAREYLDRLNKFLGDKPEEKT